MSTDWAPHIANRLTMAAIPQIDSFLDRLPATAA
jgi:hypothetical protein